MKIAIIGTGISGLTCGYHLHKQHDITLYEANDYIGGHTATVDVELEGRMYSVDTGFIVYNDKTYPNFIKMMNEIGVSGKETEMSFSVRNDNQGLEYNGHTLRTLFAQKRNLFSPTFYRFIFEILRFNQTVKSSLYQDEDELTLGEFLENNAFSDYFCENYILPMGAAIWSSPMTDIRAFPFSFFARFFLNHGLLDVVNRPQWYVIEGGSKAYIPKLTKEFRHNIRLNSPVEKVWREGSGVWVMSLGKAEYYDHVILACHSDQALKLLADPNMSETEILQDLAYQANDVTLHLDESMLPTRKAAWASWNYHLSGNQGTFSSPPVLTYNMNILQHIESEHTFCVTLNGDAQISEDKVLRRFTYHHPVFNLKSMTAQQRRSEINGKRNTWFCGAYWHNGFHEDGVRSALSVVEDLQALSNACLVHRGAA
ncbi:NAD(P)/FAD-dependent oxidoreductase [Vibrio sp. TRT 17S01]|uniref:NAD(P)/FAD-dependent oxidoreductase n=1 Tax=Vibrio sp. TRT 17S01 TaxID=3418505 RepID=UPI003CF7A834